jgi:hypothetical protein
VTIDWAKIKHALVRLLMLCIHVAMAFVMVVWCLIRGLGRGLMKGD